MKKLAKFLMIAGIFLVASYASPTKATAQGEDVSFQTFYDALSPYGSWVTMDPYGYVWIPNVGEGFSPYASNGYWANTEDGWTWVSNFDWGWAPFHYGRWEYKRPYGWFWIPDYTWAPAWVDWTYGPGYYGWAPLGYGMTVDFALSGDWHPHNRRWCFVPEGDMGRTNIGSFYIPRTRNVDILPNCHIVNQRYSDNTRHVVYISGPRREDVARITHRNISVYKFSERNKPGHGVSGHTIHIYRPAIEKRPGVAPRKVEDIHNITPVTHRNSNYIKKQPEKVRPQIQKTQPFSTRTQENRPQPEQRPQPQPRPQQQQRSQPQPRPQPQQRSQPQPRPQPQQRSQPQPRPQPQQRSQPQPRPQPQQRSQPQPRPQPQQRSQPQQRPQNNNSGGGKRR